MRKLEQIAALVLAAGLAIPSYWLFWTLAGGGGYERRELKNTPLILEKDASQSSDQLNQI